MEQEVANNVILFPVDRIVYPDRVGKMPMTMEDIQGNIYILNSVHIEEIIQTIFPQLIQQLAAIGLDITQEKDYKDGAFMVEALRSLLLKVNNIEHPFQKIASNIFEEETGGNLRIVKTISLDLEEKKVVQ